MSKDKETIKFEQAWDGDWIQPKRKGYLLKCCGCGLIHEIDFRLYKDKIGRCTIQFKAKRLYNRVKPQA